VKNTIQKARIKRPQPAGKPAGWALSSSVGGLLLLGAALVLAVVSQPSIFIRLSGLPEPKLPTIEHGIEIFDRNDQLVCTIYGDRDQHPVHLSNISRHMQQAILAAEDHDFYQHDGVNVISILRAILVDVTAGHPLQGGSTISQQLVKNLYFEGRQRTIVDKFAEALMALELEKHYSKKAILEAYLNCVYFGHGAYGIDSASQYYFGKHASDLDIGQSAFLAGLVTAPSELCKTSNRQRALSRQHLVLESMRQVGYASAAQIKEAENHKLAFATTSDTASKLSYYTSAVINLLQQKLQWDNDACPGYRIYTYMDPQAQRQAQAALAAGIKRAPQGINQGAVVSISVADGGIIAMVGGAGSYELNQWNRATSPHTVGSAFKPFVYLAGLGQGTLQPDTILDDKPLSFNLPGASASWNPRNFDGKFMGPLTIRQALALSRNTCAVEVAQMVGPEMICSYAHRAGITAKLEPNLSLALGSCAVSPLELANAYATLARGGEYMDACLVRRLEDAKGNIIEQFTPRRRQVFQSEPVAQLVDALQDVVRRGTGSQARLADRAVAGKTGTADAARDLWFVGFTPDTVTAVWGGNDEDNPVKGHVSGGSVMASIFQQYMRNFYSTHPIVATNFPAPACPLADDTQPLTFMPKGHDFWHSLFGSPQGNSGVRESGAFPEKFSGASDAIAQQQERSAVRKPSVWRRFARWLDL
jgi:penicillin-binding protein 1A